IWRSAWTALGQSALKEEAIAGGVQRRVNLPPTHLRSLTDDERRSRTDWPDPLGNNRSSLRQTCPSHLG
ncbi:MAG: hypothetical protein WAM10_11015, partial [Methylocella sp.]